MSLIDHFKCFCRMYKKQPDYASRLYKNFGNDIRELQTAKPALIWLEANACSGDSISMLNAVDPEFGQIIRTLFDIRYWLAVMPEQGIAAQQQLFQTAANDRFILIVEGAIATAAHGVYAVPFMTDVYQHTSLELLQWLAPRADFVVAAGTCAAFGGPSAARPNLSKSKGCWEVIDRPVVNVSGCPINPDWLIGTLFHLLFFGLPELDRYQRPTLFFGQTNHSICQRRSYYDTGTFAGRLGDPECMYSLGCMGPVTGADCAYRLWNDHLNWPVKASTPCIGCTKAGFPDKSTPFFSPLPIKPSYQPGREDNSRGL